MASSSRCIVEASDIGLSSKVDISEKPDELETLPIDSRLCVGDDGATLHDERCAFSFARSLVNFEISSLSSAISAS